MEKIKPQSPLQLIGASIKSLRQNIRLILATVTQLGLGFVSIFIINVLLLVTRVKEADFNLKGTKPVLHAKAVPNVVAFLFVMGVTLVILCTAILFVAFVGSLNRRTSWQKSLRFAKENSMRFFVTLITNVLIFSALFAAASCGSLIPVVGQFFGFGGLVGIGLLISLLQPSIIISMVENTNPIQTIKRCWALTDKRRRASFLLAMMALLLVLVFLLLVLLLLLVTIKIPIIGFVFFLSISAIAGSLIAYVLAEVQILLYLDLRTRQEKNLTSQVLLPVLGPDAGI